MNRREAEEYRAAAFMAVFRGMPAYKAWRVMNKLTPGMNWSGCSKADMAAAWAREERAFFGQHCVNLDTIATAVAEQGHKLTPNAAMTKVLAAKRSAAAWQPPPPTAELIAKQWPGFKVSCTKCGSELVELDNSMGYSETSGQWGSVDLHCVSCDNRVTLVGD